MRHSLRRLVTKVIMAISVIPFIAGMSSIPAAQAIQAPLALPDGSQSAVSTNMGIYGGDTWDIAVDGDHVYTIASSVPNGFFYSTDAAATWQRPSGTYDLGSGTAVEVDPATHAVYVALDGLYKSTDYGASLTKIAANIGSPLLFAQSRLFGTWNDIAYLSADGGATFTPVTIAAGENIMSYAASATAGTFYAVTRSATTGAAKVYVSADNGVTWAAMNVDPSMTTFTQVNADPYNASILTLSDDNNLWLSTNSGATWTKMGASPARSCSDFSIWTSTRWYACAGYSTNNGASWTDMDMHANVMRGPGKTVVVNAADTNVLYGDCMSGVCKSTNGGLTWRNSLDGITGVNVNAISYTTDKTTAWIASGNGLGKSTNFNSTTPTWTWPILPCDPQSRCDSSGIGESVWVKPSNPNVVLAGSIGGWVYRSTNGGTTWTAEIPAVINLAKFKSGSTNNLRPQQFINDPTNTSIVYLAMTDPVDHIGAVLKSTDAGASWTDLGIADDAPAKVLAVSTTGVLYAGTGEGKQITTPKGVYKYDGTSWTKLTGIDTRLNINSVVVDPEVQTTVYATASNDLAPLSLDGFYRSLDSGATWAKIVPTGFLRFGSITVEKTTSPNTLYMSATDNLNHGVLLKSSDQGVTWGLLYQGLKAETFNAVVFDGLVVGSKHGVYSLKSKAALAVKLSAAKVKKNRTVTITGTLKDAANKHILKSKTLGLYQLNGKKWKLIGTVATSKTGTYSVKVKLAKTGTYRLAWTPNKQDKPEYAEVITKNYTITVTK